MASIRTFIAIDAGERVRKRAGDLIERLRISGAPVKWVNAPNMHLTLKFLGNVPSDEISGICHLVEELVEGFPPFAVHCQGVGAFPNVDRPRVIWLGITKGYEEIVALQQKIEEAMTELGIRPEPRQFQPHLTLGRIRRGDPTLEQLTELLKQNADFDAGAFDVYDVAVYSSSLKRQGPEYTPLIRAPLG